LQPPFARYSSAQNWFIDLLRQWTGVKDNAGLLVSLVGCILVLASFRFTFFVVHRYFRGVMSQNILRDMRRQLYEALINKYGHIRFGGSHPKAIIGNVMFPYKRTNPVKPPYVEEILEIIDELINQK
jgi:ABC-type multidrug transport system fused ATPase/permease subunit